MGKIRNIKTPDNEIYDIYGKNVENIDWSDYEALPASKTSDDVAYFIDNVPAEEMADENIGTFSGALATFDNAMAMPMPKLKASIVAKQDLHGYDHPWVGGSGKNKLGLIFDNDSTNIGAYDFSHTDSTFTISGTSSVNVYKIFELHNAISHSDDTYTFSAEVTGTRDSSLQIRISNTENDSAILYFGTSQDSKSARITASINALTRFTIEGLQGTYNCTVKVQLEKGSNATSYAPYSNICPISGWDEANVSDVDDVDNPTVTLTTTISLGQTVYGGELDVVNGTSGNVITYGFIEYDGSEDEKWTRVDNGKRLSIRTGLEDSEIITSPSAISTLVSNLYKTVSNTDTWNCMEGISLENKRAFVSDGSGDMSVEAFRTALASQPLQVKFPLATPTTFTTQPTLIKSLNGINNLSVDSGEVIEGEYFKQLDKQIRLNDSIYGRSPEAIHAIYADIAENATQDESGNNIKNTYANAISISNHTITLKNKNGTSLGTVTVPDNNTTYTIGTSNNKVTLTPSSGSAQSITVPYATSAGSATKATQDESGNNIKASYASSFSIDDHTITLKNKNGLSLGAIDVPNDFIAPVESITTPTSLATFNASAMPMPKLKVSVEAKQEGSGTPSPENVRPISGWDAVNVEKASVLQLLLADGFTSETVNGITMSYLGQGLYSVKGTMIENTNVKILCPVKPLVIYGGDDSHINFNNTVNLGNSASITFYNNETVIDEWTLNAINRTSLYRGMRGKAINNFKLAIGVGYYGQTIDFTFRVEMYSNDTMTTYPISLPQTVYGGEVDVVNGGGSNTHGFRQGFTRGALDSSGTLYKLSPTLDDVALWRDAATASTKIMSNMFEVMSLRDARTATTPSLSQYETSFYVGGYVGDEATLDALLANLQVKYELATPTTLTTQPTPIKSLNGQNNLSVDSGEVIELHYVRPEYDEITAKIAERAGTVLQKQLHHTGSSVEEHKILFSSKETTSTDQNKGDAYDCVSKDDGFSYYTSDNEHGLVLTTLGKNMVEGDYLTFASLTNKELRMFSRPNLSSGTQPDIMTVKPDDIVISKDGWDGNVANSSLKTTLAKARKGVSDYTLTSYGSSTNCDWSDSFVHKNNGVVYLNAFVEVTSNLSAGDTIFTFNNNTPICPYNIGDAGFPVIVEDENDNLTLNYISCLDNNNFEIKKPVSAGNYINVSFVYLNNKGE